MMSELQNKYGFELVHIGINQKDDKEAKETAEMFTQLFGFTQNETPGSIFASDGIEVMKTEYLGNKGHIAIKTTDMPSAMEYLKTKGIEFNEKTIKRADDGHVTLVYLKNQIGGFAIHLVEKK